jgi:hypothetical protein
MAIAVTFKKQLTPSVVLVILNYIVWRIGVFLDRFAGDLDVLGSQFCRAAYAIGYSLVIIAICYAFIRRFILPVRKWDFWGIGLAALAVLLIWIESEMSAKY